MQICCGGQVPQPADWLRAWRSLRTPTSARGLEQSATTESFISALRGRGPTRAVQPAMAAVMVEVRRRRKREIILRARSLFLTLDDRGEHRLLRYRTDLCLADPLGEGVLRCLRVHGHAEGKELEDFSEDHAQQMAWGVQDAVRKFATPLGEDCETTDKSLHITIPQVSLFGTGG